MPTLALVVIALDEERGLPLAIASARPYVDEVVVAVDSRTTDNTRAAAGPGAKVFDVEFTDFAAMRVAAIAAARSDWILMLDGDEQIEGDPRPLLAQRCIWELPRHHWADLQKTLPAADEQHGPDRQRRLFPNDPVIRFERPVHENAVGLRRRRTRDVVIHHFKEALRDREQLAAREALYCELIERARRAGHRFRQGKDY